MDPVNVIQLVLAGTSVLVLGRMGFALARYFERRLAGSQGRSPEAESRLRAVEDECTLLRQELSELRERQEFTERLQSPEKKAVTPH
jgi:hypothetical protein